MTFSDVDAAILEVKTLDAFGNERHLNICRRAEWYVAKFRLSDVVGIVQKRHATDIMCNDGFADFLVAELKRCRVEEIESSRSLGHLDGVSYSIRLNFHDAVLEREWINPGDRRTLKLIGAIDAKFLNEDWILRNARRFPPRHASAVREKPAPSAV